MKILVAISKVPDSTSKISFKDNNTQFDEAGIQFIVNPYDEWYALVRALELKENLGGAVTTITVGEANADPVIRKALAIGADDAVRIDAEPVDALFTANQIASFARDKGYDLIMFGKETINYNGSQVGAMAAGLLDLPYVSNASSLEVSGSSARLERDIQGGSQVIDVDLPAVISASKGMAEQRIPNMKGIMSARKKKLEVVAPIEAPRHTEVLSYSLPEAKSEVKLIDPDNPTELIELLHKEAKVI
ncbi:MAG TPA: electron transfer flavoprotein subunit alpha [Flavobacteriales bacterium]|mgnify:CR=1 FL=1|jgi:electron transfer flavoprotein beta subunit|nr:electron transfer flavoprotein subunit alpha [Flavobacteriales bacterium]